MPEAAIIPHPSAARAVESSTPPSSPCPAPQTAEAMLAHWLNLSEIERRTFLALCEEIGSTSDLVESKATVLSQNFRTLAESALDHAKQTQTVIDKLDGITVDGKTYRMHDVTQMADSLLQDIMGAIMDLSRNAMLMVYAMEDVSKILAEANASVQGIEIINRQTNLVALNARIEAERAGAAGVTFKVVADEVKDLSNSTNRLASTIRTQMANVIGGINRNSDILRAIATLDTNGFISQRSTILTLNAKMQNQAQDNATLLANLEGKMTHLSRTISSMVTDLQFQDRAKQQLAQVIDVLKAFAEGATENQGLTAAFLPPASQQPEITEQRIEKLLAPFKLSAMRKRFVERIVLGKNSQSNHEPADAGNTIELF